MAKPWVGMEQPPVNGYESFCGKTPTPRRGGVKLPLRIRRCCLGAVAAIAAVLWAGCASAPAPTEGAVRYRGRRAQVLVVRAGAQKPIASRERPKLGHLGRGATDAPLRQAVSVITPEALGRLADDLDAVGFFALPHRQKKAPTLLPPLTIALDLRGRPPRLVRLDELKTRAQAVSFAESAATILRAAERR